MSIAVSPQEVLGGLKDAQVVRRGLLRRAVHRRPVSHMEDLLPVGHRSEDVARKRVARRVRELPVSGREHVHTQSIVLHDPLQPSSWAWCAATVATGRACRRPALAIVRSLLIIAARLARPPIPVPANWGHPVHASARRIDVLARTPARQHALRALFTRRLFHHVYRQVRPRRDRRCFAHPRALNPPSAGCRRGLPALVVLVVRLDQIRHDVVPIHRLDPILHDVVLIIRLNQIRHDVILVVRLDQIRHDVILRELLRSCRSHRRTRTKQGKHRRVLGPLPLQMSCNHPRAVAQGHQVP